MPRLKKKPVEVSSPPVDLSQTLTAGRSRRTIKPNPKYLNDNVCLTKSLPHTENSDSEVSIDEYDEHDDDDIRPVRKTYIAKPITPGAVNPLTGKRPRGRPRKIPDASRSEPVKNLRKEVLKRIDIKTISMGKPRILLTPLPADAKRKLEMDVSMDKDLSDVSAEKIKMVAKRRFEDSKEQPEERKKVINPAAIRQQALEKSTLARKVRAEEESESARSAESIDDEDLDDEQFSEDAEISPKMIARKSVAGKIMNSAKQQISPFARRVLIPGLKSTPVGLKRKPLMSDAMDNGMPAKVIKRSGPGRPMLQPSVVNLHSDEDAPRPVEMQVEKRKPGRPPGLATLARRGIISRPPKSTLANLHKTDAASGGKMRPSSHDPIDSPETQPSAGGKANSKPHITIVNISDIMKMKSKSASELRRGVRDEGSDDFEDDSDDQMMEGSTKASSAEKLKTNNQLVATILERKRPIPLEHLREGRPVRRRGFQRSGALMEKSNSRGLGNRDRSQETDDEIDFEDVLHTNIVTTDKASRMVSGSPDENKIVGRKTMTGNNNNLYKTNNNGRLALGARGPGANQKRSNQPPRILNSTMKLGETRGNAKLYAESANNHYSIDLSDPENNVTLVASTETSPVQKRPLGKPVTGTGGPNRPLPINTVRPGPNSISKPQAYQRGTSSIIPATSKTPRMKKVTCYETWYVINVPPYIEPKPPKVTFAMTMIGLGNMAASIKLPSDCWSYKTILSKRKHPPDDDDEVYEGTADDYSEDEKRNYEPCSIMFRRKSPETGKFKLHFDRAVVFKNDTFVINIEGKNCQLVGAPTMLSGTSDIETLLEVVDYITLPNVCVELLTVV